MADGEAPKGVSREGLQVLLAADTSAPRQARRAVEALGDRLSPRTVADLRSVVSELVAICLSPSHPCQIELRVEIEEGRVCCKVRHPDDAMIEIGGAGHALRIIGALVEEWGLTLAQPSAWLQMPVAN